MSRSILHLLLAAASCLAALSAAAAGAPPSFWYWHEAKPLDRSTRFFRVELELPGEVQSAPVFFACDDRGIIRVNGTQLQKFQSWHAKRHNLAPLLKAGKNVISFEVYNGLPPAGVLFRGEILLKDGTVIPLASNGNIRSSAEAPEGWTLPEFDASGWKMAEKIGPADRKPWSELADMTPFYAVERPVIDEKNLGRIPLDDFADISSWLGGYGPGARPGAAHPFSFSFGSVPDPRREDGWAGAMHFDTVAPRGEARFGKNSIFKMPAVPAALLISADPEGNAGEVRFAFVDRFDRTFTTVPVRIEGRGWKDYRLDLNAETLPGYEKIGFPIALRTIFYRNDKPAKSRILLDDFFYIADMSNPAKQLEVRPDYTALNRPAGEPVLLSYRLRNARNERIDASLELKVYDPERKLVQSRRAKASVGAGGFGRVSFRLDPFRRFGGYCVEVTASNGHVSHTVRGWLGVFTPNNGRFNKIPMWFGVEDQEVNTAPYEAKLHAEWMKLLGVDMIRGGLLGHGVEGARGESIGFDGYRRLWQPHVDAGLDICLDYAGGIPNWTKGKDPKPAGALWPSGRNPELFREHIRHVAEFTKSIPAVKYFEWFNEPNLSRGINVPEYMESMRQLYPIFKQINPSVRIGTGGNVIGPHPNAAPGFLEQAYQVNSDFYDIALYHAHDGTRDYKRFTQRLRDMLAEKKLKKPFANTETGYRSYQNQPELFYNQARILVQKLAYSRSVGMEFYVWFMLQDYWDKYINADDSFGLVTVDNQPKPSFVAYNELIRQLANTVPAAAPELDSRLESYRFTTGEEEVYAAWPKQEKAEFSFCLRSEVPVRLIDIFGNVEVLAPVNGIVFVNTKPLPFYLRAKKGAVSAVGELVKTAENAVRLPGETRPLELEFRNPYRETVKFTLRQGDETLSGSAAPGERKKLALKLAVGADAEPGVLRLPVSLELAAAKGRLLYRGDLVLRAFIAQPVGAVDAARPIRLDDESKLTELVFDPTTPRWAGKDDLSAEIRVGRRADRLVFEADVRDQDHSVPMSGAMNWRNDSIQLGFANRRGEHSELTVSGGPDGRPIAWCHHSPDPAKIGAAAIPLEITREEGVTHYRFEIPLAFLKIGTQPGELFRMALLVNDNDSGKRLRLMEHFGGIEGGKDTELFGWCRLQ